MSLTLHGLLAWLRAHPAYGELREALRVEPALPQQPFLPPAGPALLAALAEDLNVPLLVVVPTVEEGRRLVQALRLWLAQPESGPQTVTPILSFPDPPVLPYERAAWTPEAIADRMQALSALFMARLGEPFSVSHLPGVKLGPPVVVASLRALVHRTLPYRQFRRTARHLEVGARESLTALARHCSGIGYEAVGVVEAPGQIGHRGGILDIFPPQAAAPYRLDFFGDEIDTIRTFDPTTQRSTGAVKGFWLTPVREALPRDGERALAAVQALLAQALAPELRAPLEQEAEALRAGVPFPTLEYYTPYFYQEAGTLVSYLPAEALVVLYGADALPGRWAELEAEAADQRQRAETEGLLPPGTPQPYVSRESWQAALAQVRTLALTLPAGGVEEEGPALLPPSPSTVHRLPFTYEPHFAGRIPEALGRLRQWVGLGDQVVVVSRQAGRLAELWEEFNPPPVLQGLTAPPEGLITFVQGASPGGWQLTADAPVPAVCRHLITDEELFGWRPPEPRRRVRRRANAPEFPFADLRPGDLVVHEDYGIGVFRGLVARAVDEVEREYLLLEYAGADRVYVPIHQADRLTRYVGAEGIEPHLHRLSGGEWAETKAQAQAAAVEVARDLLDLYAARQVVPGHAFAADTVWQGELEAAFPYVETEDQLRAIADVKTDMEKPRPMDRLICGDAGYGKTEVALRAAFKAVMDGKQVAVLVPTTILAQQHFRTFRERLASFPVIVEQLSRFRTPAEQRDVLYRLAQGQVDIVIGTHRLIQDDVRFKDLGLLVIDEEQRFGVVHKEKLKQLRTEVDVLTLTATPIPRTLYLALTGTRDINIIETPPQERLPVSVYLGPYDGDVARRAILRELARGGQIFYIHNRVESIYTAVERLKGLVPEIRLAVAHGQMPEKQLAAVMEQFTEGAVDLLLATSIVESGLDFPNANTLIVERADRFGLAELYQLRGRVGRGTRRGYAYFFHGRRLGEEAEQRLAALRDTESAGGGFAVAMRDLELRGAGEVLGIKQHGQIAAVGFTLYTRMLSRAVRELKAQRAGEPPPPEPLGAIAIELPLAAGLPPDYVPDDALRLNLYRRMADLTTAEEIAGLEDELRDRFGPLPPVAETLLYLLRLKLLAREARIPAIAVESGQIVLRPSWLKELGMDQIGDLRRVLGERARVGRREFWLPLSWEENRWRENLQAVLAELARWWEQTGIRERG